MKLLFTEAAFYKIPVLLNSSKKKNSKKTASEILNRNTTFKFR